MKITKEQLKQIIKEEMQAVMDESYFRTKTDKGSRRMQSTGPDLSQYRDQDSRVLSQRGPEIDQKDREKAMANLTPQQERVLKWADGKIKQYPGRVGDVMFGVRNSKAFRDTPIRTSEIKKLMADRGYGGFVEESMLDEAEGETPQQAAERLKSMPPHRLSSVMMDFEDMADGDTSLQQYYPHVKDLAAFAREVLSLMGNK